MTRTLYSSLRGVAGFGCGIATAWLLISLGYIVIGVIVGAAIAGASLTLTARDIGSTLLAALGLVLGVWLGGLVIVTSFGFFAYDQPYQETLTDMLGFYCVFASGFGVVGAGFAAITASRIVSLKTGTTSFGIGGAVGGAVIVLSGMLHLLTGTVVLTGIVFSFLVAGALCGAAINASNQISISILPDNKSKLGNQPLSSNAQ
jgi:hypothetical protein